VLSGPVGTAHAQTRLPPVPASEIKLVRQHLAHPQRLSFARNREFCGYLGRAPSGQLVLTRMVQGYRNGCTPPRPPASIRLLASIHTHGAYDPNVPAEFPTTLDMDSDAAEGVNGYIATPGGRLWYVYSGPKIAVQLCGLGCLPQDSRFRAGDDGAIAKRYNYRELHRIEHP